MYYMERTVMMDNEILNMQVRIFRLFVEKTALIRLGCFYDGIVYYAERRRR